MIAIIGYDKEESNKISIYLDELGIDNLVTKDEKYICQADKLILPHCENVEKIAKKIQLFNLTSVIRMIRKPILGIMNGALLMSDNIPHVGLPGLGYFEVNSLNKNDIVDSSSYHFNWRGDMYSKLTKADYINLTETSSMPFITTTELPGFVSKLDGQSYHATIEYKKHYAIYFNIFTNKEISSELIKNFNSLW